MQERHLPMPDAKSPVSKVTMLLGTAGRVVISLISMTTGAAAHVKWFVTCNVADQPIPLEAVFTPILGVLLIVFVTIFYIACQVELTPIGATVSGILNRLTDTINKRASDLLRAATAVSFALLWANGSVILTPELKGNAAWLSAIQVLIPIYLFGRATLPAAGAGILVLYGYSVAVYGVFHLLDYPVFPGLATYFVLSVSQRPALLRWRLDCLRWTVALSLLWPSMEKFVFPSWIAPIAAEHPELTLGFDVSTFITAAGVVEFGLAFALFWTPMVRRLAALVLALILTSATLDFGRIDGIGHMLIIVILVVVIADPGEKPVYCAQVLAPLTSAVVLPAFIFLYSGAHSLYYGKSQTGLILFVSGVALLALILAYLNGLFAFLTKLSASLSQRLAEVADQLIAVNSNSIRRNKTDGLVNRASRDLRDVSPICLLEFH